MESNRIRIAVIIGTVRPGNYTSKAAALVIDELRKDPDVEVDVIDPASLVLPAPGIAAENASTESIQEIVSSADGVVLAGPEYHGSVASVMKLIIENLGFPSVLAGKPIALLGVAAGAIGAIKSLEQLRMIGAHLGAIVLPSAVSVALVQTVFDKDGACQDEGVERRVRGVATGLLGFIR